MPSDMPTLSAREIDLAVFDIDCLVDPESGDAVDGTADLLRRLHAVGIVVGVAGDPARVPAALHAAGVYELCDHAAVDRDRVVQVTGLDSARTAIISHAEPSSGSARYAAHIRVDYGAADGAKDLATLPVVGLPSALDELNVVAARAQETPIAVCLDYDGTLTPIVDHPQDAVLASEVRSLLAELAGVCPVAIVSGRDLASLHELVGLDVDYIAEHGMVRAPTDGPVELHPDAASLQADIDAVEADLQVRLAEIAGVLIERKRLAVAVHDRLADAADIPRIVAILDAVRREHLSLRIVHGKRVHEFRPDIPWDKGRAVEHWAAVRGIDPAGIVFIGDDRTDEDVFAVIRDRGIGVVVWEAPRPTMAGSYLNDPAAVTEFLRAILAIVRAAAD